MLSTILNFALAAIMWILGLFVYSMLLLQVILSFTVTLPLSKDCYKEFGEYFDYIHAKIDAAATIIADLLISLVPTVLVIVFGNYYAKCGYFVGMGIAFLLSLGKLSKNNINNMKDFHDRTFLKYYHGDSAISR